MIDPQNNLKNLKLKERFLDLMTRVRPIKGSDPEPAVGCFRARVLRRRRASALLKYDFTM